MYKVGDRVVFGQSVGTVTETNVIYQTDIVKRPYMSVLFDGRREPETRMEEYQLVLLA